VNRSRLHGGNVVVAILWVAAIVALLALGTWQVQRRAWKLDLIARVEAGLRAAPIAAPATAGPDDVYRRVVASGSFIGGKDSFVQALTVRGPGWWVMTPFQTEDGRIIIVNRGYLPERRVGPVPNTHLTVTGLVRANEPGGGFLRSNDPAADRWYSRDVGAIAARRGIGRVAPYFIDADGARNAANQPVGGLTVVSFPNNHLVYAITWYTLAIMAAAGLFYWTRLIRQDGAGDVA
jgi:surfeit locus 1 family protein